MLLLLYKLVISTRGWVCVSIKVVYVWIIFNGCNLFAGEDSVEDS